MYVKCNVRKEMSSASEATDTQQGPLVHQVASLPHCGRQATAISSVAPVLKQRQPRYCPQTPVKKKLCHDNFFQGHRIPTIKRSFAPQKTAHLPSSAIHVHTTRRPYHLRIFEGDVKRADHRLIRMYSVHDLGPDGSVNTSLQSALHLTHTAKRNSVLWFSRSRRQRNGK